MVKVTKRVEQSVKKSPATFLTLCGITNVLIIVVIAGLAVLHIGKPEPLYEGKRLSGWLAEAKSHGGGPILPEPALEAVRHMGTNAFPSLARMLTETDSNFKRSLISLDFFGSLTSAETRHERALAAFRSLGPEGKGALPLLLNLLTNKDAASDSIVAMTLMGPVAQAPLVSGFRALDRTSRLAIVDAVGKNYFNYPANIPFLTECLGDKDAGVRSAAALFLGEGRGVGTLSRDATDIVQALSRALQDSDARVRTQAALSLSYHGVAARAQGPAVVSRLQALDAGTHTYAAKGVKRIDADTNSSLSVN